MAPARRRWPPALAAPVLAAVAGVLVANFAWHGADLPAQVYRSELFERYGMLTFDTSWYGGHYAFTYSLFSPILASFLGLKVLGLVSAVAASAAWARLVGAELRLSARRRRTARNRSERGVRVEPTQVSTVPSAGRVGLAAPLSAQTLSAVVFAAGTAVPLMIGQLTFLAGMAVALWSLALLVSGHRAPAIALAAAATLTSPLVGLFLAMALLAWVLAEPARRQERLLAMAAAVAPLAVSAVAFHEAGAYSFPVGQLLTVLACSAVGWLLVPRQLRALRIGLVVYALVAIAVFVVANPVGGNVVRLGSFLAPALIVATCWSQRRRIAVLLLVPALFWQWSTGVYAVADAKNDPTRSAAYFHPLVEQAKRLPQPMRLEIPFTNQHWEAAYVAPDVPLARGWERQLDVSRNPLFYGKAPLTPQAYQRWLYGNGVTAVALPDAELDMGGKQEAALLRRGLPYLQPVWHDEHWTLWKVIGSPGLVSGPARLSVSSPSRFELTADRPATVTVRYRFTDKWSVLDGQACVEPAPGGWTNIRLLAPGGVTIGARPFGASSDCPDAGPGG